MKKYDRISSLAWFFFAAYICVTSLQLPLGSWQDPGPGFLPLGTGICLGLLSAADFFRSGPVQGREGAWYSKERWKSLLLILMGLTGFSAFLDLLGFVLTTFFLLVILFRFIEPQPWKVVIGGSLLASVASYVVFQVWLKTQLPTGIFGF